MNETLDYSKDGLNGQPCFGQYYNPAVRIISGDLRGREVRLPKGSRARPTTGYVRELLMNLFTPDRIRSGAFLDICAGSGITGFEAVSRGAPLLFSVEVDRRTCENIREHARIFGVENRVHLLKVDARRCFSVVRKLLPQGLTVSCCFADPPFIEGMAAGLLPLIGSAFDIWNSDSRVIIRTPDMLPDAAQGLVLLEKRRAGNAWLWIYGPTKIQDVEEGTRTDERPNGP
jgi:16S rRNA (guanine(966)-N(2))-methyltransferase RsmD